MGKDQGRIEHITELTLCSKEAEGWKEHLEQLEKGQRRPSDRKSLLGVEDRASY